MLARILSNFPAYTYALTLVSDPDNVLADEEVLAALAERGYELINEPDPVRLRYRIEQARPFRAEQPLIIITGRQLIELPYDLWQQGHHVTLALHSFFPSLAYPVVRALTPAQRSRLSQVPGPSQRLGREGTIEFLLQHVFEADQDRLQHPAALVEWLNKHHQRADQMPEVLAEALLARLCALPAYALWPLRALIEDRDAFARFVREQWSAYVGQQTGQPLNETPVRYVLCFEASDALQDAVAGLVRSGALPPVCVKEPESLPRWARPAVMREDEDRVPRRVGELLGALAEQLTESLGDVRWEEWQTIARTWAELETLRRGAGTRLTEAQEASCKRAEAKLDEAFLEWLRSRYAPLGAQGLPIPHHVHHVPHYIAFQRRQGRVDRFALLVMDGMSLADWYLIGSSWRARHPDWQVQERLLIAQIPTITAVSRQALISGLRPADLAETLGDNRNEPRQWEFFWAQQEIVAKACPYVRLALERRDAPAEVSSARTRSLCLIEGSIDEMLHGARLGAVDVQASLQVWMDDYSLRLEALINSLLGRGFTLFLTSDHGHVEACGMGQPSEGVTVQTRCKRARVYDDRLAARQVQKGFPRTILWEADGLLPEGVSVLMPESRLAFAPFNEIVVTHGGPTLEEVVVPLVTITSRGEVDNG